MPPLPWLVIATAAADDPCAPRHPTASEVAAYIAAAHRAYDQLDAPAFAEARDTALRLLPCVREPVPAVDAAGLHRLAGLAAFLDDDRPRVLAALAAAHRADPKWSFDLDLPDASAELRGAIAAADRLPETATIAVDSPGGALSVDGEAPAGSGRLFSGQPALVQRIADDRITHTAYLADPAALPDWIVASGPRRVRPHRPIFAGAAAAVVAGGGLLAAGWGTVAAAHASAVPPDAIAGHAARANAFGYAGQAVLGAGLVAGVVAFAVPQTVAP